MPAPETIPSAERKRLRGLAMSLKPAVVVGRAGPTQAVIKAVNDALDRDKLIKIRIEAPDRAARKDWLAAIAGAANSTVCGSVGHTASLYRGKPTGNPGG